CVLLLRVQPFEYFQHRLLPLAAHKSAFPGHKAQTSHCAAAISCMRIIANPTNVASRRERNLPLGVTTDNTRINGGSSGTATSTPSLSSLATVASDRMDTPRPVST